MSSVNYDNGCTNCPEHNTAIFDRLAPTRPVQHKQEWGSAGKSGTSL